MLVHVRVSGKGGEGVRSGRLIHRWLRWLACCGGMR